MSIKLIKSMETIDFLFFLYQLNNDHLTGDFKVCISEKEKQLINKYFHKESFFAGSLFSSIIEKQLNTFSKLIEYLENELEVVLISYFIDAGYGPKDGIVSTERIEDLLMNKEKVMTYIDKQLSLPNEQKWILLQFFHDPKTIKDDLIQTLKLFYKKYYHLIKNKVAYQLKDTVLKVKENIKNNGIDYLECCGNIKINEHQNLYICISYFLNDGIFFSGTSKDELIMICGYQHPKLIYYDTCELADALELFKTIADETRLNILKLLKSGDKYGREIARAFDLSNSNVSYHTTMLLKHHLIEKKKENHKIYFSLNASKLKKIINDALDELFGDKNE